MNWQLFFNPGSIAIVGASPKKVKTGNAILSSLIKDDFPGKIFTVNPNVSQVLGIPCYPDLKSIGEVPDLVIITTPSQYVIDLLQQCAQLRVKAVVIITSGLKEINEHGTHMEESIAQIAKTSGIEIIGPNCIGLMSPHTKLNASFAGSLPLPGKIGYFSQSGSILAATIDIARSLDIGFSRVVNIGNKAHLSELDMIKAFADDPETKVIAGYLETFDDGDNFIRQAELISREKPILLIKSGVTAAGARAALSHTARLTGSERAFDCVFERAGVVRCASIKHQLDIAWAFAEQPLPRGPNVAIIASAGGSGIMAADAIEKEGLQLAALSDSTINTLSTKLDNALNVNNPVEIMGNILAGGYELALRQVLDDPGVHIVLVLLTPHALTQCTGVVQAIIRVAKEKTDKPILACLPGVKRVEKEVNMLSSAHIPCFDFPEKAVATIKAMVNYSMWRSRPKRVIKLFPVNRRKVEKIIERHLKDGVSEVVDMEVKTILKAYGFVIPEGMIATSPQQAVNFANQIGYPVVLKVWSPGIIHKTEVGGVKLGLANEEEVKDAFDLMMYRIPKIRPNVNIPGILVEKMCDKGQEVILGMNRDPRFGPLIMFGTGGKLVEILKDVAFYPAPLTAAEAKEMLINTRTYNILTGINQGEKGVAIDAIAEALQRVSQLVTEFPQIRELDINPFVVGREGTTPVAVDATIILDVG
ncbi:MAG: CoA-binding protein [Candidatus Aminicenantes bacterium]|nr:CoA-binding protein [Candidatus Aminicenantes bacterium]NIM81768.1 CoA-binding protein [Candidatus Aminicenantes bacterium]NIN21140.1 CoA-binding protein [Candidatus Aminicenantes bacterium]NIN44962.1 CoA-binding protein [Candidatus Aminicenantes bacterium]NIN87776.1 CoA-binding protein [Candidatus Aminicenantes bacterium]